jgi:Peptidase family C25
LDAQIFNGTLVINYNGHGGPSAWCDERIFTTADIPSYNNLYRMPLYITATCDFGPYSNPAFKSAAEKLLSYNKGGAIALMTTTQLVFQYENQIMNSNYWKDGFKLMKNGKMPTLGDAFRLSKNRTYYNTIGDLTNYRKFALLGDPALQLAFPKEKMVADSLNGKSLAAAHDTLKALNVYELKGRVVDQFGNQLSNFNGTADITIFDKVKSVNTLGNNSESPKINYQLQTAQVAKSKVSVVNGIWIMKFIVPKDIDYAYGIGKISMYASSQTTDAQGFDTRIVIGGTGNSSLVDNKPPVIKPFMNSTAFVNGGITGSNATFIADISDDNGINTSGSGIGHDITATIDGNTAEQIVLNNFFESVKDTFTKGLVKYPIKNLAPGNHTITIRAWDILNNSSQATVDFVVVDAKEAQLERVYNYPNPFTTKTSFCFDHNFPGEPLYVTVQVYTVSGQMIRSIRQYVNGEGSRVNNIDWDGKDEMGDNIGRGVYMYKLHYKTQSGISVSKYQKLIKL